MKQLFAAAVLLFSLQGFSQENVFFKSNTNSRIGWVYAVNRVKVDKGIAESVLRENKTAKTDTLVGADATIIYGSDAAIGAVQIFCFNINSFIPAEGRIENYRINHAPGGNGSSYKRAVVIVDTGFNMAYETMTRWHSYALRKYLLGAIQHRLYNGHHYYLLVRRHKKTGQPKTTYFDVSACPAMCEL